MVGTKQKTECGSLLRRLTLSDLAFTGNQAELSLHDFSAAL